jgi:hopanoid biosynthesis associated glycosyl transferase protein HpnI
MSGVLEHSFARLIVDLCVAGVVLGSLYHLTAIILVLRFPRARKVPRAPFPAVTVLRPLHGDEPGLFARVASLCRQDYPGPVDVICGVQHENDTAIPVVRLLQDTGRPEIQLNIDGCEHGSNRKISNLINMQPAASEDVVVILDSDIAVDPHYVASLVAELQEPGVGAVTCAYHGTPAGGIWAQLSAMSINLQFLPNVIAAVSLNVARPCLGATIALHREVLTQIGGFRRFADELADDYAIGSAVRALGRKVVVSRFTVGHVCFERDFRAVWGRQLRGSHHSGDRSRWLCRNPIFHASDSPFRRGRHPGRERIVSAHQRCADLPACVVLGDRAGVSAAASSLRVDSRAGRNCICNLSEQLFRQKGRMARQDLHRGGWTLESGSSVRRVISWRAAA